MNGKWVLSVGQGVRVDARSVVATNGPLLGESESPELPTAGPAPLTADQQLPTAGYASILLPAMACCH